MGYGRFALMIAASAVLMFGLMYLNTYETGHLAFSQTRVWMALLMAAAMGAMMLGFMWRMYRSPAVNMAIVAGCAVAFLVSLWLVRSQRTVDDVAYMKAMIPHHSIAVMTSERARIRDAEVRALADRIIEAQVSEIAEMRSLIANLESRPPPDEAPVLPSYRQRGMPPPE